MQEIVLVHRSLTGQHALRTWENPGVAWQGRVTAHPTVEIAWVEAGLCQYRLGSATHELLPGEVMIVPPAVEHGTTFQAHARATALAVEACVWEEAIDALGTRRAPDEPVRLAGRPRLPVLGRLLHEEASAGEDGKDAVVSALLEALMVEAVRALPAHEALRATRDRRIKRAVELVQTRTAEALTVDDLAAAATMSRFHFSRLFRAEVGTSPYRYLLKARAQRAAAGLRRGVSVTEAALEAGFRDLGRFGKQFQSVFGMLPHVYRSRFSAKGRTRARPARVPLAT